MQSITRFLSIASIIVVAAAFFVSLGEAPAQFPDPGPPAKDECGCTIPNAITMTISDVAGCACLNGQQIALKKTFIKMGGQNFPTWQGGIPNNPCSRGAIISADFYCGKGVGYPGYVAVVEFVGKKTVVPLAGTCAPLALTGIANPAAPAGNAAALQSLCLNVGAPSIKIDIN